MVIPVKGPIYGLNRYLYSAALRLHPFMAKAMEVNPEYKSGVEWVPQAAGCQWWLPSSNSCSRADLECIALHSLGSGQWGREGGPCCVGSARPPYTFAQASALERSLQSRLYQWEHNMTRPMALSIIWQDRRMPTTVQFVRYRPQLPDPLKILDITSNVTRVKVAKTGIPAN